MHTAGVAWTDQKGKNTVVMWYNPENTHRIASILVPKTSIKNPQGVSKCITFYKPTKALRAWVPSEARSQTVKRRL